MNGKKKILAFDFGASSGRAMLGVFDGEKIELSELHRFSNDPVCLGGTLYWDTLRLFHEIKQGLIKAKLAGGFDSIGINTWGVDFGLLDKDGVLLESGVNYRDKRTAGMVEKAAELIPLEKLYKETGNQIMEINTAFQLLSLKENRPALLERAETMLLTPDLFNYFLTGEKKTEYSIASTTQLVNPETKDWNADVIDALGLPQKLFGEIVPSGTKIGELSDDLCEELGLPKVPVIAVCGHDTQDAVVSVPTTEKDFIFVSCGTWSLFGTESDEPIVTDKAYELNLTNEGGYGGTTDILKNIIGLWLIQESRRQWQREGKDYSFADLEKLALESEPFKCFVDPDYPTLTPPGNLPKRIQEFCEETGQYVPQTVGEIVRCIYESLSLKYRYAYEQIKELTGKDYKIINIVGGGTKDGLLCQMTANSCNTPVSAGPIEATVLGNIAVQLMSDGSIPDTKSAREIIAKSDNVKNFAPESEEVKAFEKAYGDFKKIIKIK